MVVLLVGVAVKIPDFGVFGISFDFPLICSREETEKVFFIRIVPRDRERWVPPGQKCERRPHKLIHVVACLLRLESHSVS